MIRLKEVKLRSVCAKFENQDGRVFNYMPSIKFVSLYIEDRGNQRGKKS